MIVGDYAALRLLLTDDRFGSLAEVSSAQYHSMLAGDFRTAINFACWFLSESSRNTRSRIMGVRICCFGYRRQSVTRGRQLRGGLIIWMLGIHDGDQGFDCFYEI